MNIYEKIKSRREELGMSQQELAEKTGYKTRSAINKIESGMRDLNQSKITAFANALQTTPAYLMGWDTKKETRKQSNENDELNEYLEDLKNRPEMRMLFKTSKGATKADVERAVAIIEALKKEGK